MPRSNRPRGAKKKSADDEQPLNLDLVRFGARSTEVRRGVEYTVQTTSGANADDTKTWTCPNCHLQISKGIGHTVAWDSVRGVETRRHFHNHCWKTFQGVLS